MWVGLLTRNTFPTTVLFAIGKQNHEPIFKYFVFWVWRHAKRNGG